jgi:hypothetical protein
LHSLHCNFQLKTRRKTLWLLKENLIYHTAAAAAAAAAAAKVVFIFYYFLPYNFNLTNTVTFLKNDNTAHAAYDFNTD